MKNVMLSIVMLFANHTFAQVKKGAVMIGPSLGYWQSKVKNSSSQEPEASSLVRNTNLTGALRAGYFVTDKIAVGLIGRYNLNKGISTSTRPGVVENRSMVNTQSLAFGVFARSYKLFDENKLAFFGELKGVYEIGSSKSTNKSQLVGGPLMTSGGSSDITGMELALSPGIAYFITERIGMEASFGSLSFTNRTSQYYHEGEKTTRVNDTNFNIAFNMFSLGIMFYLAK